MEESFIGYLLDYGSLGLLAAYLAWWNHKAQARMDCATKAFNDQIQAMLLRGDEKEASLRERYDEVIEKYDQTRSAMITDVSNRLALQEQKLDDCLNTLTTGLEEMRSHISDLQIRWKIQDAKQSQVAKM